MELRIERDDARSSLAPTQQDLREAIGCLRDVSRVLWDAARLLARLEPGGPK